MASLLRDAEQLLRLALLVNLLLQLLQALFLLRLGLLSLPDLLLLRNVVRWRISVKHPAGALIRANAPA